MERHQQWAVNWRRQALMRLRHVQGKFQRVWELKPQWGQWLVQVGEGPLLEQSKVVKERSAAANLGFVPATRPQSFHLAQAGAYVVGESLCSSRRHSKELQISKSTRVQAKFIRAKF